MKKEKMFTTKKMVYIGFMSALVFVGTMLHINIPAGPDGTMLHFGNVFCILSGLLFGSIPGGLAAGIGSALFDLTSQYASEAWITFINKFAMGFISGMVMHSFKMFLPQAQKFRTIIAAACGSATYIILYILKTIIWQKYVYGLVWVAILPIVSVKATVSTVNGIIAVIVSVILALALRPALIKTGVIKKDE